MDSSSALPNDTLWPFNIIFWLLIDIPRYLWIEYTQGNPQDSVVGDFYTSLFVISSIISIFLIAGTIYALVQLWKLRVEEEQILKHPAEVAAVPEIPREEGKLGSLKWQVVERHISSPNPTDWRLAVLEADIMLDDMVRGFGYSGINLGERLKSANNVSFATLNQAWEAHKIRNAIAHEGSGFELSEREARRVINLYQAVFEEFNYI